MNYIGVDLHKQTITVCVVNAARTVLKRQRFSNLPTELIVQFLSQFGPFEITVEATASYEWFVRLVEPSSMPVIMPSI